MAMQTAHTKVYMDTENGRAPHNYSFTFFHITHRIILEYEANITATNKILTQN